MEDIFMGMALFEAIQAGLRRDFPVGAVLTLNSKFLSKHSNSTKNYDDYWVHAESYIIGENITELKKARQNPDNRIELYTTLEPCLDCISFAARSGIKRIIYACPNPYQGDASLDTSALSAFYQERWPEIEQGPYESASYDLLTTFMKENNGWDETLKYFQEMKS